MWGIRWTLLATFFTLGWGLGAVEQTRVYLDEENPRRPSELFLENLNEGRKTLVFGKSEMYPSLLKSLRERNHDITLYNNNTRLSRNGYYNYDSVVILGSGTIDRRIMNGITTFYDLRWTLPKSYDERYKSDVGNLLLPPSLLVIGCQDMREFGIERCSQRSTEEVSLNLQVASTNTFGFEYRGSVSTGFIEGRKNEFARSILEEGSGFIIQGDFSWSRLGYLTDELMCSGGSELDIGCLHFMDWIFHRRDIKTWSNLQHFKVKEGQEFHEFTGLPIPNRYLEMGGNTGTLIRARVTYGKSSDNEHGPIENNTASRFKESELLEEKSDVEYSPLHLESRRVYTIRDELVIGFDYYELQETDRNVFAWKGADPEDEVYGQYNMMVPYVRQTFDLYGNPSSQHTRLMTKISKTGELNHVMTPGVSRWIHFKAPVQHGVFKLIIRQSNQHLNTPLWIETLMPLRTYKHNEEQPKHIM
ncbi:hypothetical protein GNI_078070 [Gregarina niphandrodes]|uniref:Uncharacterized protein n=1 Tax=Gregarina niphandrodes TaxID=110365 RepID=A0A023B6R0_GRENI|nr:hypothetical protein GNI_078070 [Gregarina niphandrodes]EZG66657.1 hypothetical protein GNI_078070 [Gregarina niphandrodes]|eukprot:XP_011130551.1 hypothetical protein GNI_078070 [Gregarina niphandrodes]